MSDPAALIDRQTQLANFLVAGWPKLEIPGIPPISAAAAVGNGTQENQCKSVTTGPLDHGSNGIFQWRLDRLTSMQAFAVKNFGVWNEIEPQAAFFSFECKGWYHSLWVDLIAGTKSLATLTANICEQYERPAAASAHLDQRIKYATDFMAVWKPTPPIHPPEPPTPPIPPPVPPPVPPDISRDQLVVAWALASSILSSTDPADIRALAAAIVREMS